MDGTGSDFLRPQQPNCSSDRSEPKSDLPASSITFLPGEVDFAVAKPRGQILTYPNIPDQATYLMEADIQNSLGSGNRLFFGLRLQTLTPRLTSILNRIEMGQSLFTGMR